MQKALIIAVAAIVVCAFLLGRATKHAAVELIYKPDIEVIEVHQAGDLTYEIQPTDGALYTDLVGIIAP